MSVGEVLTAGFGLAITTGFLLTGARSFYHGVISPTPTISRFDVPAAHKAFALVAQDTYALSPPGTADWVPLGPSQLTALGLDPQAFEHGDFRAHLYVSRSGHAYALAFAGTDPHQAGDWWSDAAQGAFGAYAPTQYWDAFRLALQVNNAVGSADLTMVGHSLGGGMAAAAACATNRPMVSFNAAGLSASCISTFSSEPYTARADNYFVEGDAVTNIANDIPFAPNSFGTQHQLPRAPGDWGAVSLHKMEGMLRALGM